jgi:hypothetical protein
MKDKHNKNKKIIFKNDLYITLDRTPLNFKNIEFEIIFNKVLNLLSLKLTKKGKEQFKNMVVKRKYKYGSDEYLTTFMFNELNASINLDGYLEENEPMIYNRLVKSCRV